MGIYYTNSIKLLPTCAG